MLSRFLNILGPLRESPPSGEEVYRRQKILSPMGTESKVPLAVRLRKEDGSELEGWGRALELKAVYSHPLADLYLEFDVVPPKQVKEFIFELPFTTDMMGCESVDSGPSFFTELPDESEGLCLEVLG